MTVAFSALSADSRIWIFQASRPLTGREQQDVQEAASKFLDDWTAHGKDLLAGFEILYDQFLLIGVNEAHNGATGCSIDKLVSFVSKLDQILQVDLLNHNQIAVKEGDTIKICDFYEVAKSVDKGVIKPDTQIFNNSIGRKHQLQTDWLKSAQNSWMSRYFAVTS
jgi:hypothetical protein